MFHIFFQGAKVLIGFKHTSCSFHLCSLVRDIHSIVWLCSEHSNSWWTSVPHCLEAVDLNVCTQLKVFPPLKTDSEQAFPQPHHGMSLS